MLNRRTFVGAVAASCMALGCPQSGWAHDLDWVCEPIQLPPASTKKRAPVVTGVCLAPNEAHAAIVGDDHLVYLYDIHSKKFNPALSAHRDWVRGVSFSPDGSQLVTVGNDRLVLLWNAATWEQPLMLAQQPQAVFDAAFSPNGDMLATVGFCSTLHLFELETKQERLKLDCPCDDMRAVAFSMDGKLLAAGGRNGIIRVWELPTGQVATEYKAHRQRIRSLQFNSLGQILSCGDDQLVRLDDLKSPTANRQLPRQSSKLFDVILLDDQTCATSGSDNLISIWKLDSGEMLGILRGHTGTVSCLSTGRNLLVSGSYDTQIRIWQRQLNVNAKPARQTNAESGWSSRIK